MIPATGETRQSGNTRSTMSLPAEPARGRLYSTLTSAAGHVVPQMPKKMGHLAVAKPKGTYARFGPSDPKDVRREVIS